MVIVFWIIQIYNFIQLHIKYDNISTYWYTGWIFVSVFFPLLSMVVARILLGFLLILHNNQELIEAIKKILQVFPEGIIIQSFDENVQKLVVKFVNNAAVRSILKYDDPLEKSIEEEKIDYLFEMDKKLNEANLYVGHENLNNKFTLSEMLLSQTIESRENNFETSNVVIMHNKNNDTDSDDESEKEHFNIKTLQTKWENNNHSYIHVFINTTALMKFELQKARNECLQIMFSSVSHEFRNPINAFSNSMAIIESNYHNTIRTIESEVPEEIRGKFINKNIEELNEKFFRICKISTTSLMSLVEDILDLAKIEAGTYSLNEQLFSIRTLVQDIQYVFEFQ